MLAFPFWRHSEAEMSFKVLKLEEELGLEVGYGNSGRSWGCWVAVMKGTTDGRFRSMRKLAMDLLEGGSKGKREREDRRVRRFWLGYQVDWLLLPCQSQDNGGRCGLFLLVPGQCADCKGFSRLGVVRMDLSSGQRRAIGCLSGGGGGGGGSATRECDVVSQWIHKVSRERSEPWTGNAYLEMLNL